MLQQNKNTAFNFAFIMSDSSQGRLRQTRDPKREKVI